MINKEELLSILQTQFGIYLNLEKHKAAFQNSLDILAKTELDSNSDVFYTFLHSLILDILHRMDLLERSVTD